MYAKQDMQINVLCCRSFYGVEGCLLQFGWDRYWNPFPLPDHIQLKLNFCSSPVLDL